MSEKSIESISRVGVFAGLTNEQLHHVLKAAGRRSIARDDYFFRQGQTANALYVLEQGHLRVTQVTPEGEQVILHFVSPGEMYGGCAVFGDKEYPGSAQAVEESSALTWSIDTVRDLVERFPRIGANALQNVVVRLRETQDRYSELATERVERRVAKAVIRLAEQNGHEVKKGTQIDFPISKQDIAEMTGTTLYSVSRILSDWERKGWVEAGRMKLIVRSPADLLKIVDDF